MWSRSRRRPKRRKRSAAGWSTRTSSSPRSDASYTDPTKGARRSIEVRGEEALNPRPAVGLRRRIVPDRHRAPRAERRHHARVRAHVAVAGLGIDLHVVRDAELVEQPAEATALRREHAIAAAVAAEDGADAYEVAAGRGHVAVENRGDAE